MDTNDVRIRADISETLVNPKAYADHRIDEARWWLRADSTPGLAEPPGFAPFWAEVTYGILQHFTRTKHYAA